MFGGGVPPEKVRVDFIDIASLVQLLRDFIDQVLTHDVIAQLLSTTDVEDESSDFATHFALTGLVSVIFRARRREFCDDVTAIEFVRHFS